MLQVFGQLAPPPPFQTGPGIANQYGDITTGLVSLLNNIIRLLIMVGGLWAFINLILAGYGFLSAGDDPKKVASAWQKIWQSMMGVLFIIGSFVLASIFGYLLFGKADFFFKPIIYGP